MTGRSRARGFSLLASLVSLASSLAGCAAPATTADATESFDAGAPVDARVADAGVDAGRRRDAALGDAGAAADAGREASVSDAAASSDGGATDAGSDASAPADDAGSDAGPPRPVGDAVDVTGNRCALDEAGQFWCWGRATPVEAIRLLGTGFDRAWGSCAMRGNEVWCVNPSYGFPGAPDMLRVIEAPTPPETPLRVDYLAEYSDYQRGCGVRRISDSTWQVLCWTNGSATAEWTYPSAVLAVAVAVSPADAGPRRIGYTHNVEALDISLGPSGSSQCSISLTDPGVTCAGSFTWPMPGPERRVAFGLACFLDGGVRCRIVPAPSSEWTVPATGSVDHAVAWPIGSYGPGLYYEARGVCIGGAGVRCYTQTGALAYTVDW